MDDAELVRQVLQGNVGAFAELVKRYTARIAAVCRAHIPRPDVVEELVQETFYRGLDKLSDLHDPRSFGYWLCTIARNSCRDWLNDPQNQCRTLDAAAPQIAAPDGSGDDRPDRSADLKKCIRQLPVDLREVIEIYYGSERVNYRQIADWLGVSFAKVNQMLTRARKLLRVCLERAEGDRLSPT